MPYPGMSLNQLVQGLKNGYRMEKPEYATDDIGHIMTECWNANPSQRPTFRQLWFINRSVWLETKKWS